MRFSKQQTAAVVASIPLAMAQTSTSCNPLEKTCPQDTGLNSATYNADFTAGSSANASWSAAAYTFINYGSQGAEFVIDKSGQAPTIQTDFYILFGRVDVKMKAATGTGIVSSIVFESDDLDEIDWEFLGGNTAQVETNFFGKGNTTAYDRAVYYPVTTPQSEFHTYTVDWNQERIEWIIDGVTVRTLAYNDPLTIGGQNYPQTPMRLKLGNWCGGCAGEPQGTVEWAGGKTTFDNAPYTMYVESVTIQNANPACAYEYSGNSGSWQSIKKVNSGSCSGATGVASASAAAASSGSAATNGTNSAPTSSVSVSNVMQTQAAVTKTLTGSSYSVNTASVSAQNANGTAGMGSSSMTATGASGSSPTGGSGSGGSGSGSGGSTASNTTGSSGVATQTGTSGTSSTAIMTVTSLLSLAIVFWIL